MTGIFQKLGILAGILLCILIARRLYVGRKKINPRHVRIHFRRGTTPSSPGKQLLLIGATKTEHCVVSLVFFIVLALMLLFGVFDGNVQDERYWITVGLGFVFACFWLYDDRIPKLAYHENAIIVIQSPIKNGAPEKRRIYWLNEYDYLESFDITAKIYSRLRLCEYEYRSFSYRLIKDGRVVRIFNRENYDLLEVEKIYTTANPNVESVENFGKRSECEWIR
ncbi:MAG: hypothetical protein LBM17_05915 [Candidatus Accumulibacter sp.]|jgi:hypothetical protein|nr:hypothetical protein [Accumulibacter sp.]